MPSALEAAMTGKSPTEALRNSDSSALLVKQIVHWLDEAKAEEISRAAGVSLQAAEMIKQYLSRKERAEET